MADILVVTVISARKLEKKKLLGLQSPYVEVRIGNESKRTTVAAHKGTNAEWNEPLTFPSVLQSSKYVFFTVWGNRHLTGNDRLGEGKLELSDVHGRGEVVTVPLLENGEDHGQLQVSFAKGSVLSVPGNPPVAKTEHPAKETVIDTETSTEGTHVEGHPGTLRHKDQTVTGQTRAKEAAGDLVEPSTLNGYCPTGPEKPVETDVPVLGFGAAGGVRPHDLDQTLSGYKATGGHIPEEAAALGGYSATGGVAATPGLQHNPITSTLGKGFSIFAGDGHPATASPVQRGDHGVQPLTAAGGYSNNTVGEGEQGTAGTDVSDACIPLPGNFLGYEGPNVSDHGSGPEYATAVTPRIPDTAVGFVGA